MQILPTTTDKTLGLAGHYFANFDYQGEAGDSFAAELERQQEARDAVDNNEANSVQSALDSDNSSTQITPLSQAPYNLSTTNGITYTTEEVIFTQEELQQLEKDLKANNAPQKSIDELHKLSQQPGGSTLGEVMAALHTMRDYPALSQHESTILKGLTSKLDPSGSLNTSIGTEIGDRNGKGALDTLVQAMDALKGQRMDFTRDEIAVLSKALGFNDTTTQEIMKKFGNSNTISLNKSEFLAFMAPGYNDLASDEASRQTLAKALDATLGPVLQAAKDRMEAEKTANELSSRNTEHRKVYIEKTVMENINNTMESTRSAQLELQNQKLEAKEQNAQDLQNLFIKSQEHLNNKDADHKGKDGKQSDDNNSKDAWSSLLSKTEVRGEAKSIGSTQNVTTPLLGLGSTQANNAQQQAQQLLNQAQAQRNTLSQQAAAQVENAMLTAAKDGTKKLELQLHPAELGSLTITLTARNGEVSAMIRSERTETAEMLNKQLEQLRAQLEGQGIKIDKLEVQSGTQENASAHDAWDGMDQHNARQEESARRDLYERMRNLAMVRNNGINNGDTTLERNMQSNMHDGRNSAENASQALYIVA